MNKMNDDDFLKRQTFKGLLIGVLFAVVVVSGWQWLHSNAQEQGMSWPIRRVLGFNGKIWNSLFSETKENRATPPPVGKPPRFNGSLGLESSIAKSYKLYVYSGDLPNDEQTETGQAFTLRQFKLFPRTESTADFHCIEGWSDKISYSGVRFSDFLKQTGLGKKADGSFYRYVGLMTPDEEYYVSIDMDSMLHPQTLLADTMNGAPLLARDGAPLRLLIPVKYGIKSLKRVGKIWFSDVRPPDYWAEQGYDWFAGL